MPSDLSKGGTMLNKEKKTHPRFGLLSMSPYTLKNMLRCYSEVDDNLES